jgi:nucleoside-diphosphate-sugar epimerase
VAELLRRRQRVRVLDNFSTGKRHNLTGLISRIQLREGDIRDLGAVRKAVKNVDYVLHQAALASVPRSIDNPRETNEVNIQGTLNLLISARDAAVRKFVMASSSSVYGPTRRLPKVETMNPDPISPYALTKLVGERYCQIFTDLYGLETVCLRYFNVFGPRQDPTSQYAAVIPKFIQALLSGRSPTIYGDGEQSRDFSYVSNVVSANILACRAKDAKGQVINIACGRRYTINDLFSRLQRLLSSDVPAQYGSPRSGDVRHSLANISKAKRLLKYRPGISFGEGLRRTVVWFRKDHTSAA